MSNVYSKYISNHNTPQTEKLFGKDQIKNDAEGYVFKVSDNHILERFLILGTEGGTYYSNEEKLTQDNAKTVINMIKYNGELVLSTINNLIDRVPKRDASIFVLALCCTYGDEKTKRISYSMIKDICKTSTHLFTFCQNIQNLRGWSKGLCKGVANWYKIKSNKDIAYQLVKYRQRNGWTHRDVLRLSHPKTIYDSTNDLFRYAVGKKDSISDSIIEGFEKAQKIINVNELISLINEYKLTWEMIPTQFLNNKEILITLLPFMPMTALIRNLNRMTIAGLFDSNMSNETKFVTSKFTNIDEIKNANLHPINILNSMKTYSRGTGGKGSLVWTPNQKIVDSLEGAFELSFQTIEPTNKNILVAVDVSGSMYGNQVNKMSLNAKEVAAALSLTFVKSEPNVDLIWFDTQAYKPKVGKRSNYIEVIKNTPNGGGTDCSLPYKYALQSNQKYDIIIMLTDNETWAGSKHTCILQQEYQNINPSCKHVVVGMTAVNYSVLTDKDTNVLHCAGFDSAVPQLINNFITKEN